MNIAVCVKQIPDPASPYELDPDNHWLVRPDEQVLDDGDRYGVEVALQLAEQSGGTVSLISMGPAGNLQGIRQALAMGADKAVIVDDPSLRGADSLTTARVLAALARREDAQLVISGTESTDGYSGVVPQQMAELLEMPALTYAKRIELGDSAITIDQQTAAGYDTVTAPLPAVVTVTAGVVEPRYPTFKGIMQAKSKPVDTLTAGDLGVEAAPLQKVDDVQPAPERQGGTKIVDEGEAHLAIVEFLEQAKVI